MSTRRKVCKVIVEVPNKYGDTDRLRCDGKIKPGTPFCRKHFETHKLIEVKCKGDAHSNPFIDHCGVCMPHWGRYPIAVPKDYTGPEPEWKGAW